MTFRFDPNSTKNQGRWRLRNPEDFVKMWTRQNKNYPGISYIYGILKNSETAYQAIRFDKKYWDEDSASKWWDVHKDIYEKLWTEDDWIELDKLNNLKRININRVKGLAICRNLASILNLTYITPRKITIDYTFEKNCILPVGSIRRGKDIIGDIDVIITCKLTKKQISNLNIASIKEVTGGEKRIDFKYYLKNGYVNVNIFIFTNDKTFGAALLHSSGPYQYNIRLRNMLHSNKWIEKNGEGWKLSQNGLINNKGKIENTPNEKILQNILGVKNRKPDER